jgi:radical SAM protein with 4Fe4S-binding SPASM domain
MPDKLQLDAIERIKSWQLGRPLGPLRLQINPTDKCNLKCRFCWLRDSTQVDYKNQITEKRYIELIKEAKELGVKYIEITGGGEPFMRKALVLDLIKKIKRYKMHGSLITNGTLFNDLDVKSIVMDGWDNIIFSLDSPKKETQDYLRGKSYEKILESIKRFNYWKKKLKKENPKLCIHFVVTNMNYKQLPELVNLANDLNIKNVFIEPLVVVAKNNSGFDLKMNDRQIKEFRKYVAMAYKLCSGYGIENNFENYKDVNIINFTNRMRDFLFLKSNKKSKICFEPWYNVIVRPNGRVGPCCMFEYTDEYIHNKKLKEIWFGEYFEGMRKQLSQNQLPDYCKKCNPSKVIENIFLQKKMN